MKYLSFYDTSDKEGRARCLAATNKMDYICKSLVAIGENVEIISASMTSSKGNFKGRVEQIDDGITLKLFSAYKWGNVFQKVWAMILSKLVLFFYLLFHVKRGETLLVYHALGYMSTLRWAKFFKRFKILLEVEEIYGDVTGNPKTVKRELSFFKKADAYIFPTELLNEKVNTKNKPYVIIHGTYNVEKSVGKKWNDGRTHCVYAGTFDPRKGGVSAAVSAGKFLDEKYHIHIIGFGSTKDKELLLKSIEEVNQNSKCIVSYDGLLSGEEYIKFLQSCDIGLSTQSPTAEFNETSFPSKVLSYLANGLRVVSIKIKALETSGVNDILYYYEEHTPQAIAAAIQSIDVAMPYSAKKKMETLDNLFKKDLKTIIKEL
jgi:glycosyltransferase involved in cell wall biosynthesis